MSGHFYSDDVDGLTVVDVYDLAASLGRDFEAIINTYGVGCIAELMPKIINILEQLEVLVSRNQKDNAEIAELRYSVERLFSEKRTKAEDRQKYEKEIEQIEEQWRAEVRLLEAEVAKLQEDGRRLRQQHTESGDTVESCDGDIGKRVADLKCEVREQKDRIRSLQRELKQRNVDNEALERQLQHLAQVNADYRRKTSTSHRYSEQLTADKRMLEDRLYDKEQLIANMKMKLLDKDDQSSPDSQTDDEEASDRPQPVAAPTDGEVSVDLLRDMVEQRNNIRMQLLEVEEDLKHARPRPAECEEDRPVQGPINREPEEKLFPERAAIGIRTFFRTLLSVK